MAATQAAASTSEVRGYQSSQRQQIVAAGTKIIDLGTGATTTDPGDATELPTLP